MYSRFKIKYTLCERQHFATKKNEQFHRKYNNVSVYSFYNFSSVSFGKKSFYDQCA